MNLDPTEEQRQIVATVRRFVREEIVPLEAKLDPDASELPAADFQRLTKMVRDMGFWGLDIPAEYGGAGVDLVTRTLMAVEMSQHRAGLYVPCYGVFGSAGLAQLYEATEEQKQRYLHPMLRGEKRGFFGLTEPSGGSDPARAGLYVPCYGVFGSAGLAQLYEATEEQKQRYLHPMLRGEKRGFFGLTEPSGGSDPARAIRTRAVKDGSDWVINGSKVFISGADRAHFGLIFARTDAEKGRGGITCFIVDTDMKGFHVRRVVHTLRSSHYATELQFEDLRVPHANILGEVNKGFAIANDRLSRQRIPYAAACIGVAVKAQELAIDYAKQRETFGALLATRQAVQWMIVDNEIDIKTSLWLTLAAAHKADSGQPYRMEAGMAKLVASEAGGRVVDRSMQIHGGYGMTKDLPFERWYREMRIRRVGEGPNEVQRHVIARDLLGAGLR